MSALYNTLVRMIERGQTEGLGEKIDVFYAVGRLSTEEYKELIEKIDGGNL